MASTLLPPDRCGWLDKRGGLRKNWTKRWFVLRDNELKYYKTDKITEKTSPQGTINLDGCQVEIAPETKYSRKFCFELNSPHQNRVYVIMAENGTSLQDWMNAVRRAMLRIRREKTKAANPKNKDRTASDVDDKEAKDKKSSAAAQAALATAAPPPKPTSAAGLGGAAALSTPAAASSANGNGNGAARNSASAGDTLGLPEPASSLVHRHSTASKSEVSRPVDAPPPVATSASRFGGGNAAASAKVDDNHKFDVYLQWLEEQNKDKAAADPNSRAGARSGSRQHTGHHQLLDDDDGSGGGGLCANCKCTLM